MPAARLAHDAQRNSGRERYWRGSAQRLRTQLVGKRTDRDDKAYDGAWLSRWTRGKFIAALLGCSGLQNMIVAPDQHFKTVHVAPESVRTGTHAGLVSAGPGNGGMEKSPLQLRLLDSTLSFF